MARYDLLIDGGYYKKVVGRLMGHSAAIVRPDGRRLVQLAVWLGAERGLAKDDLGSVRWYEGKLPRDHSTEKQRKAEFAFHSAMRSNGIELCLLPLKVDPLTVAGPLKNALTDVERALAPPLAAPTLIERVDTRLVQLQSRAPRFQQKGIDTLIVMDLISLAAAHPGHVSFLIAGDADFAPAVSQVVAAEGPDARSVVVVSPPASNTVARKLTAAASEQLVLDAARLEHTRWVPPSKRRAAGAADQSVS